MTYSRVPTRRPLAHLPGHFYFADLRTTRLSVAEAFYGELFGWSFVDVSGNIEGQEYRIARIAERDTAGIGLTSPSDLIPEPHWRCYLTVDDISVSLAQAVLLGARVVEPLVRIPGDGSLVTLQDPGGALVTLWQYARGSTSVTVKDDIGAPYWNELHTTDVAGAEAFYAELAGWSFTDGERFSAQHRLACPAQTDARQDTAAALVPVSDESRHTGAASHWRIYFNVHDADATALRAEQLGGEVRVPPYEMAGLGRATVLADPTGAAFVAVQPAAS